MVKKDWLNKITRFITFKRVETTPVVPTPNDAGDCNEDTAGPVRNFIVSQSYLRDSYSIANILIENENDMDKVADVYDSHECMRQFLLDLALACDLETLMEEYGLTYDHDATTDKNFTELIKKFLDSKAGKCV